MINYSTCTEGELKQDILQRISLFQQSLGKDSPISLSCQIMRLKGFYEGVCYGRDLNMDFQFLNSVENMLPKR
jgi:hypothetical protein